MPKPNISRRRPVTRRPIKDTRTQRAAYDPLTLGMTAFGWVVALGPKIQAAATSGAATALIPAAIFGTVIDHLFGDVEGDESQLWIYLLTARPAGISEPLHLAIADLTECIGRISADLVEGIVGAVLWARDDGTPGSEVFKAIRALIDETLDHHGLEARIQGVLEAR